MSGKTKDSCRAQSSLELSYSIYTLGSLKFKTNLNKRIEEMRAQTVETNKNGCILNNKYRTCSERKEKYNEKCRSISFNCTKITFYLQLGLSFRANILEKAQILSPRLNIT